jgi:hypothetical protein
MAGFLRRLRRPKETEDEAPEEAVPAPDAELPDEPIPPSEPEADAVPEADPPLAVEERAEPGEPSPPEAATPPTRSTPSAPPPLPEADRDAARSSLAPRRNATKCFLCGTEMDGPWCPTCRMAWTD